MVNRQVEFRFYEELNGFLPAEKRKKSFIYCFSPGQTVKDAIEAQGVPHTEVDLILVNEQSVGFDYQLQADDRIAVYPVFESLEIAAVSRVRPKPLRRPRFILDVHLGKLARHLRLLGLDALYRNDLTDEEIIDISLEENRIILTRDRGILKNSTVTHGYWLRSTDAMQQAREVMARFDLHQHIAPFSRCLECNGLVTELSTPPPKTTIPPKVAEIYQHFYRCDRCGKIYWQGSHYQKLRQKLAQMGVEV